MLLNQKINTLRLIFVTACLLFSGLVLQSQVLVNTYPKDLQLYPRNLNTNNAGVNFSGTVNIATGYTELHLKRYRNAVFQTTYILPLSFIGSTASFSYTDSIPAELFNYKYELYGFNGAETLVKTADNVVGGDAYIIQGQSNAEAMQRSGSASADNNNFIRVYGSGFDGGACPDVWYIGSSIGDHNSNGNTGQWGLRMGNLICTTYGIPVCLFNGAYPGMPISYFERNDANHTDLTTNYGRLLKRTQNAGMQNTIRSILFYQGESDADPNVGTTLTSYKTQFYDLYNDWKNNFSGFKKLYLFQTRYGCWPGPAAALQIQQAHKELAEENPADISIISTNNSTQISEPTVGFCHYGYNTGYKLFGERAFYLIQKDLYGAAPANNTESPYPSSALLVGTTQVSVSLKNVADSYTADALSTGDFTLIGPGSYSIVSISVSGSNLLINFTGTGSPPTGISFSAHSGSAAPSVYNNKAIGLISFYNLTVSPTTLPIDKISLSAVRQSGSIDLKWTAAENENIVSYELERSDKPTGFTAIYAVNALTTGNATAGYAYSDVSFKDVNFYRVKAKKLNGSYMYSAVIEVSKKNKTAVLTIYPNPFKGSATLSFTASQNEAAVVKIYSTNGAVLFQQQVNFFKGINYLPFSLQNNFSQGMCLIECITAEAVYSEKLMIQ
ncbi:MAG: sialate O-acetylesterase [Ferruginibacter sp.]